MGILTSLDLFMMAISSHERILNHRSKHTVVPIDERVPRMNLLRLFLEFISSCNVVSVVVGHRGNKIEHRAVSAYL